MRHGSTLTVGSPTMRGMAFVASAILLLLAMVAVGVAGSSLLAGDDPIIVDQGGAGDYETITEAVAAAVDGETILIRPGTYAGPIAIDKDITISGDGPREAIVVTADGGPILRLDGSHAILSDLTFSGPSSTGVVVSGGAPLLERLSFDRVAERYVGRHCREACRSLGIFDGSRATVRQSHFSGGGEVDVDTDAAPLIEDNVFLDGPIIGLFDAGDGVIVRGNLIEGAPVRAMGIFGPLSATIEDNELRGGQESGIKLDPDRDLGPEIVIRDNRIGGSMIGILVQPQAAPTVAGNALVDNTIGVTLNSSAASVEGNAIRGGGAGIVVNRGTTAMIAENTIDGSRRGIFIDRPSSPKLMRNTICATDEHIVITDGAEPLLVDNDLCEGGPDP